MPAPTTAVSFLDVACKSGLLTRKHLDDLFGESPPADPGQCAALLVKAELLTAYQAKQLLGGKFRGFFLGPYKILRPIGQGGMGAVYLAEHTGLGRKVAVKVLTADKAKDKLTLERFHREARAAAALDHPNIVRLHDISQGAGVHFLVMEYVDGTDLQTLMAQTGPLHFAQAAQYVAQAAAGLQHAHERGFVHRDVKPANLMLTRDGGIKILDMGLARSFTDARDNLTGLLAEGDIAGTVDFLSPEQAMNHPLDERSDVYSLGATFYALVTGHPPFNGSTAQKLMQHQLKDPPSLTVKLRGRVPEALSDVISRMMAKRPSERFQAAADVVDALGPWLPAVSTGNIVQDPITASSLTPSPKRSATRPIRPSARLGLNQAAQPTPVWKRTPVLVGGGVGLALLVGGVILAFTLGGGSNTAVTGPPSAASNPPQEQPQPGPTRPAPRTGGKTLYAVDFATTPPVSRTVPPPGRSIVLNDLSGTPLPPGVTLNHWNGQTAAVYSVADRGGVRALGLQPTAGNDGVQAHFRCDGLFTTLPAGGQARVRLTYALDGTRPANAFVELRVEPYSKYDTVPLPPTGGQWKTAEFTFTRPPEGGEYELVARAGEERVAVDGTLWVKAVEVLDPSAPAPGPASGVAYRLDASRLKPFRKRIDFDVSFSGPNVRDELPGWQYEVYEKGSDGEAVAELDDGRVVLGIGSRTGKAAAQYAFQPTKAGTVTLTPGREYQVKLEYKTDGDATGVANVQTIGDWNIIGGVSLPPSADWKTVTYPIARPDGKELQFTFGTTGLTTGFLKIRSFEILDPAAGGSAATSPSPPPVAPPAPKSALPAVPVTADFARFTAGEFVVTNDGVTVGDGWTAGMFEKDATGQVAVTTQDGGKVVTLANTAGKPSVQVYQTSAGPPLAAGRSYLLKFEYKASEGTAGAIEVREKDVLNWMDCPYTYKLEATGDQWEKRTFEIEAARDYPPVFVIQNRTAQPGNRLSVRSLEITPLGGK